MRSNASTMIHVARDGQDLGVISQELASECLQKSVLRADDLAWTDGLSEWMALGELLGAESEPSEPVAQSTNRVTYPRLTA
jgi:hypothetical protein